MAIKTKPNETISISKAVKSEKTSPQKPNVLQKSETESKSTSIYREEENSCKTCHHLKSKDSNPKIIPEVKQKQKKPNPQTISKETDKGLDTKTQLKDNTIEKKLIAHQIKHLINSQQSRPSKRRPSISKQRNCSIRQQFINSRYIQV